MSTSLRHIIQVYAPTTKAEEDEVERIYEDLQDILEVTPKKGCYFLSQRTGM